MCELMVRVIDKVHPDPYIDANHCTKRGDVIEVVEDGYPWSATVLNDPQYKVVRVPGVPTRQAQGFLAPELDEDHTYPSHVLQARAFRLDLTTAPHDLASLMAAKIRKPRLVDPNVIG